MQTLQKRYHETLLKILNNIGIIGSILAGLAEIVFVIIFILGVEIDVSSETAILFAIVNGLIGLLISILLRYQGIKYAELENKELVEKFYRKKVKELTKEPLSVELWQVLNGLKDFILKFGFTVFLIYGVIHITIQGSKNPIELLIALVSLILFACFGLISMNNAYDRYYNLQVPYMEMKVKEMEEQEQCQSLKTETNIEQNMNN